MDMIQQIRSVVTSQFEGALCMFQHGVRRCPPEHWEGLLSSGSFRQVAYHTLYFVDLYLSTEHTFTLRELHARGGDEEQSEPTAGLSQDETLSYVAICRQKAIETLAAETAEILQGPSGFSYRKFSRLELHLYNIRHIQHHTGQMSAYLRRVADTSVPWVGLGWKE